MTTKAKITKIGNSQGVRIPKKQLQDMNLSVGDEIEIEIKAVRGDLKKFSEELDNFFDKHKTDLKNLANR
jgi:antitoxin component of MazEF toxin-antitoxin module